jgi:hypothetical protein
MRHDSASVLMSERFCAAKTREQLARVYGQATVREPIRIRGLPGRW